MNEIIEKAKVAIAAAYPEKDSTWIEDQLDYCMRNMDLAENDWTADLMAELLAAEFGIEN